MAVSPSIDTGLWDGNGADIASGGSENLPVQRMSRKSGSRFPARAKPCAQPIVWPDASAGEGRSETDVRSLEPAQNAPGKAPPSISRFCPVMKPACAEHRK